MKTFVWGLAATAGLSLFGVGEQASAKTTHSGRAASSYRFRHDFGRYRDFCFRPYCYESYCGPCQPCYQPCYQCCEPCQPTYEVCEPCYRPCYRSYFVDSCYRNWFYDHHHRFHNYHHFHHGGHRR
jgi:hypothetical protein